MSHKYLTTLGLALAMLGIVSTLAIAQQGDDTPVSRGVVATVTAIDAATNMATLQTEEGEVFELPERSLWHVGHKVLCDRIEQGPRPRFLNCQIWESAHRSTGAAQAGPAPRR